MFFCSNEAVISFAGGTKDKRKTPKTGNDVREAFYPLPSQIFGRRFLQIISVM
jgi:hypothetical protein